MVTAQGGHISASQCLYNLWTSDTEVTQINELGQAQPMETGGWGGGVEEGAGNLGDYTLSSLPGDSLVQEGPPRLSPL